MPGQEGHWGYTNKQLWLLGLHTQHEQFSCVLLLCWVQTLMKVSREAISLNNYSPLTPNRKGKWWHNWASPFNFALTVTLLHHFWRNLFYRWENWAPAGWWGSLAEDIEVDGSRSRVELRSAWVIQSSFHCSLDFRASRLWPKVINWNHHMHLIFLIDWYFLWRIQIYSRYRSCP